MLWEELTAKQFPLAVSESQGVCLLPLGVLEKHGNHLPLGTDMFSGQGVCKKAAEMEKAVVFPYYFFGQISEARHYGGCIAVSHQMMMDSLLFMCDEIHRNGFKKIIIVSSHGGNNHFLPFFAQEMPRLDRDYCLYTYFIGHLREDQRKTLQEAAGTKDLGSHAGLSETSMMLYLRPDLVHMEEQDAEEGRSKDRLKELRALGVYTGFNWYAEYPHHVAGDHRQAQAELGKMQFDMICGNLAEIIREVKADTVSEAMVREYQGAGKH